METVTTKSGKPIVVITMEEYEGMRDTIELLGENPNLLQELKEERRQMEKEEYSNQSMI